MERKGAMKVEMTEGIKTQNNLSASHASREKKAGFKGNREVRKE